MQLLTVIWSLTGYLRHSFVLPDHTIPEAEQRIIDNELEKFHLKGMVILSLYEDGQVICPNFIRHPDT